MLDKVLEGGGEPAVSVGDRGLSYGELREAAAAVAKHFDGAESVAVWAESTLETCVAAVAAIVTGTPLVPINPKLGRGELEHVLSDSAPDVVLGGPDGVAIDVDARASELPDNTVADDDTALIIYTSGTTGRPKGAQLPRRAITSNLDGLADAWEWTGEDVLTHGLPLFHVHGLVLGLFGPLRRGGELRHLGPLRARRCRSRTAGRRDDDVRRPDDVPPARPRGGGRRVDRRRAARKPACSSRAPPPSPPPSSRASRS